MSNSYGFSFKGVASSLMNVKIPSYPKIQSPVMNTEKVTLPGRDGFEYMQDGSYSPIKVKQEIVIDDMQYASDIRAWLCGDGLLSYTDDPTKAYRAVVMTVSEWTPAYGHLVGYKCTITFDCQPFRQLITETDIVLTHSDTFNGLGNVESKPLLKVEGSGECALVVNGTNIGLMLTATVPMFVDCDAGIAYTIDDGEYVYAGEYVSISGDFPVLKPFASSSAGYNSVAWSNNITKVTITPRWRWF